MKRCDNCGNEQEEGKFCCQCGLVIPEYKPSRTMKGGADEVVMCPQCFVKTTAAICLSCGMPLRRESE